MSTPPAPVTFGRAASQVAVVTAVARVVGFVRWLVFAGAVGAAGVGTVYQSVNAVPNIVYEVAAGGVLAAVVVPLLAGRVERGLGDVDAVASALLTRTLAILVPVSLGLALAAPWISELLLSGLAVPGAVRLGTHLLWLFVPQVLLYGTGIVVTGVLQAHRRFLAAALAPLLSSLVVIATYLLYAVLVGSGRPPDDLPTSGLLVLGLGTTAGVLTMAGSLLLAARRAGVRLRPAWALPPGLVGRAATLAGAGLLALVAQQVALAVTLVVANRAGGEGTLVVQQYVQALYLLPYAVLAVPVATAVFPVLASTGPEAVGEPAVTALGRSLRVVLLASALAAAVLLAVAGCVGVVFAELDVGRGHGAGTALAALPAALRAWAPGLVGLSLAAVATRALYARGRAARAGLFVAAGWCLAALPPVLLLEAGEGPLRTLRTLGWSSSVGMTVSAALLLGLLAQGWGSGSIAGLRRSGAAAVGVLLVGAAAGAVLDRGAPSTVPGALVVGTVVALVVAAAGLGLVHLADPVAGREMVRRVRGGGR